MSAEEYRKRVRKTVEAPSGFKFVIRKLNLKTLARLMEVYGETPTGDLSEKQKALLADKLKGRLEDIVEVVLPNCIVKPKVVLNETTKKDELALADLEPDDLIFLVNTITDFSGLTGEAAEERKSFPE